MIRMKPDKRLVGNPVSPDLCGSLFGLCNRNPEGESALKYLKETKILKIRNLTFWPTACSTSRFYLKLNNLNRLMTLENYYNSSSVPAAIMGTIHADGNPIWHAFGPSVWNDTIEVNEHHIFRLYSMTKPITTMAALQLVEKGLIGLDDPLNDLMPEMVIIPIMDKQGNLTECAEIVTLRQLLTHTSGFGQLFFNSDLFNFNPSNWNFDDKPRLFQPGKSFAYGTGLDWVGKTIEKISGQNLEMYLRDNITGPLKMNNTWFNVPENLAENIVSYGYRNSSGGFDESTRIPEKKETSYSGANGLFGSASDYLEFLRCILNYCKYDGGQILMRETVELCLKDQLPDEISIGQIEQFDTGGIMGYSGGQFEGFTGDRWGFGWAIESHKNEPRPVNSVFWAGGANTYFTLDIESKTALVYFSNYFPFNDKEAYDFYKLFEKKVFSEIKPNNTN
jgi:methyl acetate hydrolase